MKNRRNYYRILHVQPDAPLAIVRASYRTLMQKLGSHPDLGGDELNARWLNEAYAVISDPVKRARYDRESGLGGAQRRPGARPPQAAEHRLAEPLPAMPDPTYGRSAVQVSKCPFCDVVQPNFRHRGVVPACTNCGSPQQAAGGHGQAGLRERALWRTAREQAIRFFTHWPQTRPHHGWVTDLSPEGMGLRSGLRLPVDAVIKVESADLQAIVRVLNCHPLAGEGRECRVGGELLTLEFNAGQGNFISVTT